MFSLLHRSARRLNRSRSFHVEQLEERTVLSHLPLTPELQVNQGNPGGLGNPDLAVASDVRGNFVVAWTTDLGDGTFNVRAQQFLRDGTPLGGPIPVASNLPFPRFSRSDVVTLPGTKPVAGDGGDVVIVAQGLDGLNVDVAMTPAGEFVIVYDVFREDGNGTEIRVDFFGADGSLTGKTNSPPGNLPIQFASNPSVALDDRGTAFVTYLAQSQQGQLGVVLERVEPGSDLRDKPILVTEGPIRTVPLSPPSIGVDGSGEVVVAWNADLNPSPAVDAAIVFRRFGGVNPISSNLAIVSPTDATATPDVGRARATSGFVITWDAGSNVLAQRFAADGLQVGVPFQVNAQAVNGNEPPHVAVAAQGNFVISWTDAEKAAVLVRVFDAAGQTEGDAIVANDQTLKRGPSDVATNGSLDSFVVGWSAQAQDVDGVGVVGRVFALNVPVVDPGGGVVGGGSGGGVVGAIPALLTGVPVSDPAMLIALLRSAERNDPVADAFLLLRFRILTEESGIGAPFDPEPPPPKMPIFLLSSAGEEEKQLGAISGKVFVDLNGNGNQDENEPGLSGQFVFLDLNNNGVWDAGEANCETDVEGRYAFSGLGLMRYQVRQNLRRARIAQTSPVKNAAHMVELTRQNSIVEEQNFGTKVLRATPTSATPESGEEPSQESDRPSPREE